MESTGLVLWHGGRSWEGRPSVRAAAKGRAECGPGLYFSTRYQTARKYAKGPKVVTRAYFPATTEIRWLNTAVMEKSQLLAEVRALRGLRMKDAILAHLQQYPDSHPIPLNRLVNLCVNLDAAHGQSGLALCTWLVEQGVDASLESAYGGDQWVVVFNPQIIRNWTITKPKDVAVSDYDLSRITIEKEEN